MSVLERNTLKGQTMPRMDKLSSYATTIAARNGNTCIIYHNTVIVEFDAECIILRTGGWRTVTTKRKMNQASRQFDLRYSVAQKRGAWTVCYNNAVMKFKDDPLVIKRLAA